LPRRAVEQIAKFAEFTGIGGGDEKLHGGT
jgi:hypothetical protein